MAARGVGTWGASRASLGRELCARDGWQQRAGGVVRLARNCRVWRRRWGCLCRRRSRVLRRPAACASGLPLTAFSGSLAALGAVRVADTAAERRLCGRLLEACHPLGRSRAPGCRLTYLLEAESGVLGVQLRVGAVAVGSSRRAPGLGTARGGSQVVSNDRFLLLPSVRVPHLASHVLGRAVGRLASDWSSRHGVRPVLVETCVEASRPATSYRAAGWESWAGPARRSRPPSRRRCRGPSRHASCWGASSGVQRGSGTAVRAAPSNRRRIVSCTIRRCGDDILQPHREALVERSSAVLLVQDTTTLNYTGLKESTQGLGPLRTSSARGLFVHAAVAFSEGRRALGVSGLETSGEGEPALVRSQLGRACPHTRGGRHLLKWQAEHAAALVVARAGDGGCRCGTRTCGRQCCARWGRSRTSRRRCGPAGRCGSARRAESGRGGSGRR